MARGVKVHEGCPQAKKLLQGGRSVKPVLKTEGKSRSVKLETWLLHLTS